MADKEEIVVRVVNFDELTRSLDQAFETHQPRTQPPGLDDLVKDAITSFQRTASELAVLPPA
ncbi:MAG: hypothetical protein JWN02_334 [Acidobacteria bacterium]|nr:hypothetical protein [Acidobacteriota bacterium]